MTFTRIGVAGVLAPLLLAVSARAQRVNQSIRINPNASIRIMSLAGTIRVTGWDRPELSVTGTVPTATGRFYIGGGGNGAKLGVDPVDPTRPAEAELDIKVPRNANVWIKTERGSIVVEGLARIVDAYAVSGSIVIRNAAAQTTAESMDGAIDIEGDVTWLRVRSADGRIAFRGSADDVSATSVTGDVRLGGGLFRRVWVSTIGGAVVFEGGADHTGSLTFETHSGDVDLRFTAAGGALPPAIELEVSAVSGRITNLLTTDRPTAGRGGRGQELSLLTGEGPGGAHVQVRTFKGEVRIKP